MDTRTMPFVGMCVGGPYDGRRMEGQLPELRVHSEPLAVGIVPLDRVKPVADLVDVVTYCHHRVTIAHLALDLWIPKGQTLQDAFHRIYARYRGEE